MLQRINETVQQFNEQQVCGMPKLLMGQGSCSTVLLGMLYSAKTVDLGLTALLLVNCWTGAESAC